MVQQFYSGLTRYEGAYIFYVVPILYFLILIFRTVYSKTKFHGRIGFGDVIALVAISLICVDFVNYLYLFLSKTGEVLPFMTLFVKYMVGFFLWLWVLWYSYEVYFTRRIAGEQFTKRLMTLVWLCVGSLVLVFAGIAMS